MGSEHNLNPTLVFFFEIIFFDLFLADPIISPVHLIWDLEKLHLIQSL